MTNSIEAVKIFTKSVIDAKPWLKDPLVIKKAWNEDEYNLVDHGGPGGLLCFAIMWDNEVVRPFPPMKRAMDMTKAALEAAGHKGTIILFGDPIFKFTVLLVVDWNAHRHIEIYKNAVSDAFYVREALERILFFRKLFLSPMEGKITNEIATSPESR